MRLLLVFLAMLSFSSVLAQKKEISQARSNIKSRSNLAQAEASMRSLLADSANRRNVRIYLTLAEAVRAQYEEANEKLYLKEGYDTAAFFDTARRMFMAYESLDSVEAQPDKKGKVKPKYRKKNAEFLYKYRRNLYNGGVYFLRKKDYARTYGMMDTYMDCSRQPLFTDYSSCEDSLYVPAAFWTVFCGYKLNSPDSTLRYSSIALKGKRFRRRTLAYISSAYLQQGDTLKYVEALRRGFEENKKSKFFFTRLMDYYNSANQLDTALSIADEALAGDSLSTLFLFAKSNVLLNMGDYAGCINISDKLLARNDTFPDVYLNAGVSYLNLALSLEKDIKAKRENREKILNYYRKAMPYMEKYRMCEPDDRERWAPSLYNIYLKLNMGRKFEEISGILRKMRE